MNRLLTPISLAFLALVVCFVLFPACTTRYIEGTKIEDSDETREVIRTVELYRKAMEERDADMLIALASKRYFEKNGDSDSANNYDYEGLLQWLRSPEFRMIAALKMTIVYKSIVFNKKRDSVTVRYHYTSEFKLPAPATAGGKDGKTVAETTPVKEKKELTKQDKEIGPADGETEPAKPLEKILEAEARAPEAESVKVGGESVTKKTGENDRYDREVWHSKADENEMIMELEGDKWYILKGM